MTLYEYAGPHGDLGMQEVEVLLEHGVLRPAKTKTAFRLCVQPPGRRIKRWPKRNLNHAVDDANPYLRPEGLNSYYCAGTDVWIETSEATPWVRSPIVLEYDPTKEKAK